MGPIAPTPHTIRKSLSYPIYKEGTNPDAHVRVFPKAINANGEKDNASIVLFYIMANNFKDKAKDSLLVSFFQASLQLYLRVAMALAKCDNLFQQKEVDVYCEKNMGNVKNHWKILELPNKLEKDNNFFLICGHCCKPNHTKECCHWNLENPKEGRVYC